MGKGIFDGADWWREVVDFRKSTRTYLNSRGINEDDFIVDALQGLWNDKLVPNAKIHILMLLQEFSPLLLQSDSSIEQVIVSLQDVFRQRAKDEGSVLIQTHILLTITDISITHNCILNQTRLVLSHVENLLDVVRNINRPSDSHMRAKACACLLALETRFPCLLSTKLEHLSHLWTIEISSAGSVYLALFTTVLQHLIAKLAASQARLPDNCLSNAMCNRTEPLLPFNLPMDTNIDPANSPVNTISHLLPDNINIRDLESSLNSQVAGLSLASPPLANHLIRSIVHIFRMVPSLSSSVLQPYYARFSGCQDLQSYHTIIHLMHSLGVPSVDSKDFSPLIKYLFACTTHTGLLPTQRKLSCEFLKSFKDSKFNSSIGSSFLISALDDPRMTNFEVRCATIVSLCELLIAKADSLDLVEKFRHLSHPVSHLIDSPSNTSIFFRTIFKCLPGFNLNNLQKFLVDLYKQYIQFTPYIVDLTQATSSILIDSSFSSNLIKNLLDEVICTSQKRIFENDLKYALRIMQASAELEDVALHKLLHFVKSLLGEDELTAEGDWKLGNQFLVVCRVLMQHHTPLPSVYGDILHLLMTNYQDLDIRDRASLYYAMWTHLSPEKLIMVLSQLPSAVDVNKLPAVMTQDSTHPNSIVQIDECILYLERKLSTVRKSNFLPTDVMESVADYLAFLDSEKSPAAVEFTFDLKLRENKTMSEVYTVVLKFDSGEHFHDISDLRLYHLSSAPGSMHEKHSFDLSLQPKSCVPVHLSVSALLTSPDNQTIQTYLEPVHLSFHHLWLPLDFPSEWAQDQRCEFTQNLEKLIRETRSEAMNSLQQTHSEFASVSSKLDAEFPRFIIKDKSSVTLPAFLPPKDHLFLHFKENKKGDCVCHITVSDVQYLPLVSQFLIQFVQ